MLYSVAVAVQLIGFVCFMVSMLPFLTDQVVGATSDELSAMVLWFIWSDILGTCLPIEVILLGLAANI